LQEQRIKEIKIIIPPLNISIIIFCNNEQDNIENVIQSVKQVANSFADSYEIIVVDDGSTDATSERMKKISGIKSFVHPVNRGIGGALRTGYAAASKEFVCAIPGDAQFDVNELLQIKPFGKHAFYSFFRPSTNYSLYRRFLNFSNNIFNRFFLGLKIKDVNWIKVYRKEQLELVNIQLNSSLLESEICAKLISLECLPIELPSLYLPRTSGEPKGGNWKTLRLAISEMWLLYLIINRFKKKHLVAEP
jgi:glycosyltransferase involved in cell wall biosynthesis